MMNVGKIFVKPSAQKILTSPHKVVPGNGGVYGSPKHGGIFYHYNDYKYTKLALNNKNSINHEYMEKENIGK